MGRGLTLSARDAYIYVHKSPYPSPRDAYIYAHLTYFTLRVFLLTLHTAEGFVALISFYELRTSRITALNTIGAARQCAFLSRLANIHSRGIFSNARLEDLQETESSHSLMLVRSFAVHSRWLGKDTQ